MTSLILITFDDGMKSNLEIADLIKKYNFKGFLVPGFVGSTDFDAKQFMNHEFFFSNINTLKILQ